jgi:hypothetical protein
MRKKQIFGKESTVTLENVLGTANAHTTGGRENGTARTDACRLDIELSPLAVSSILLFTASWKKWFCVLRHHKGFGLFDSVRFGLWLARGGAGAAPTQPLRDEVLMSA